MVDGDGAAACEAVAKRIELPQLHGIGTAKPNQGGSRAFAGIVVNDSGCAQYPGYGGW